MRMPYAVIPSEVTTAAVVLVMREVDSTAQVSYNLHCAFYNGTL